MAQAAQRIPVKLLAAVTAAALLSAGCATTRQTLGQVDQLIAQGKCAEARAVADHYFNLPNGRKYTIYGAVYAECDRQPTMAYRYWTLAARYGEPGARDLLVRNGQAVPSPDLAAPQAVVAAPIILQAAPAPSAPSNPVGVNCTSRKSGNTVQTSCF